MRIQGEERFEADREQVWRALMDPDVLASSLPGFQKLEQVGDHRYEGVLALGVGPVQGRFEGRVALRDLDPPSSYRLEMSGRGSPGFVEGEGRVELTELEETPGTMMTYDLELKVGGKLAAVGQRMLEMTARMLSRHALERLARAIESGRISP